MFLLCRKGETCQREIAGTVAPAAPATLQEIAERSLQAAERSGRVSCGDGVAIKRTKNRASVTRR